WLRLNAHGVQTVLAVDELQNIAERVADGAVVFDHDFFERLDKPALDVSSFGCLDGGIDETFTTSHGVEEELLRRQTTK
ncbi:hypothetical protein LTR02_018361, partial [Friedmanniomyces endolithicus]